VKWRCGEDGGAVVVRVCCGNGADSGEECCCGGCGEGATRGFCFFRRVSVVAGEVGGGGYRGGWKERRKLGLGFWEMKMMTWQNLIG